MIQLPRPDPSVERDGKGQCTQIGRSCRRHLHSSTPYHPSGERRPPLLSPPSPQETDVLQHEVRILEEDRARLMREVALKTELEGGYAKRGAKQSMAIKEAQSKIATLDQSMQQVGVGLRVWASG